MQKNWRKQNKTKYVNEYFAPVFAINLTKFFMNFETPERSSCIISFLFSPQILKTQLCN